MKQWLFFTIVVLMLLLGACNSDEKKNVENGEGFDKTATVIDTEEKSVEEKEEAESKANAERVTKEKTEKEAQKEQAFREEIISQIILEETSCEQVREYVYSKGYVKNTSMYGLFGIQIRTEYLDSAGGVVDTDGTYAVAPYEFILPDERKYFEIMTPANANIASCNTYVIEFDM